MSPTARDAPRAPVEISPRQVTYHRLKRSGLIEPFSSAEEASRALIGVQAQLLHPAGIALWNRTPSLTLAALEDALYRRRSLVKLWGQRRTLHLYAPEDWPLLTSLFDARDTWTQRAVTRFGGDPDQLGAAVASLGEWMRHGKPVTRPDLEGRFEALDRWLELGSGLFMDLVQQGVACHGEPQGSRSSFVHRDAWLPDLDWNPPDRDEAGIRLARRYMERYGPATYRDVAYWLGVAAGDAKRWVAALERDLVSVRVAGLEAWVLRQELDALQVTPPTPATWRPRLLHRFDALLLAHHDKSWLIDPDRYKSVWRKAGYVEAVLLVRGRIGGTWRYERRATGLTIELTPFGKLARTAVKRLEREAAGVAGFFGLSLAGFRVS